MMRKQSTWRLAGAAALLSLTYCAYSQNVVWETIPNVVSNSIGYASDGSFILSNTGSSVVRIDPTNGDILAAFALPATGSGRTLAIHPGGVRFAVGYGVGAAAGVGIYDTMTGVQIAEADPGVGSINRTAWNPAGTRLAVTGILAGAGVAVFDDGSWGAPAIVLTDPVNPFQSSARGVA